VFFRKGVVVDHPKRKERYDDALEVGPTHNGGVVRAMPDEGESSLEGVGSYTQSEGETPSAVRFCPTFCFPNSEAIRTATAGHEALRLLFCRTTISARESQMEMPIAP
jgi:hypothetical protein